MKTVYSRPICPACYVLKAQLIAKKEEFKSITVYDPETEPKPPGEVITRGDFNLAHPGVRAFPFVVES